MSSSPIQKPGNFFIAAMPLFLVLFIDSMGLGLVFPILNALVFDPATHFISSTITGTTRNLLYGMTVGIYMFCWFFGAAFLGDVSDQIGRKKSIMVCLLGAFVGYLFSAIAVVMGSYTLLLTGRIIAGFTAGSQSIAQAAIVDLSQPETKARNLGLILFFTSLGFMVGPMLGGLLSASGLVSWFNYAVPFYFAATISLLNAILLYFFFHETFSVSAKLRIKLHYAIEIFLSAFKRDKIRELSFVLLVMMFGWSSYYSFISMYLLRVYHFTSIQNGFYMGLMGAGFGVGTGFLVEPMTRRFSLKQCIIATVLTAALGTLLTIYAPSEEYVWGYVLIIAVSIAIAYSTILTLFSNLVDEASQGWVMGITGAIMAFAFGVNGLLIGLLANLSPATPLMMTVVCLTLTAVLLKQLYKEEEVVTEAV